MGNNVYNGTVSGNVINNAQNGLVLAPTGTTPTGISLTGNTIIDNGGWCVTFGNRSAFVVGNVVNGNALGDIGSPAAGSVITSNL